MRQWRPTEHNTNRPAFVGPVISVAKPRELTPLQRVAKRRVPDERVTSSLEPLESVWDSHESAADEEDRGRQDPTASWVPPILGDLIRAVRKTALYRFSPFMSLNRLCFSTGPQWWAGNGEVVPASIELSPDKQYAVVAGGPYGPAAGKVSLATTSAKDAAAEAERLLSAWSPDSR